MQLYSFLIGALAAFAAAASDASKPTLTYTISKTVTSTATVTGHSTVIIVTYGHLPGQITYTSTAYKGTVTSTYTTLTTTFFTTLKASRTVTIPVCL